GCGVAVAAALVALTIPTAKRAAAAAVAGARPDEAKAEAHAVAEAVPAASAGLSAEAEQVVDDAAAPPAVTEATTAAPGPRHAAPETPAVAAAQSNGASEPVPQPNGSGSVLFGRVSDR